MKEKQINIWCGAGISMDEPCALPGGYELSHHIFKEYMLCHQQIYDMWRRCNEILKNYVRIHDFIRPEVMVSCITRMPGLLATKEFFANFSSLSHAEPNKNHSLLAVFLETGGTIYTTNFDVCIEKAYEKAYHQKLQKKVCCNGKVVIFAASSGGKVVHLHGTFESGEMAGASVERVMSGFDTETIQFISKSLKDKINLFIGYSFSDDYDLNNVFHKYCNNDSRIHICNHRGLDELLGKKAKDICGKESVIIECRTTTLLEYMFSGLLSENATEETPVLTNEIWGKSLHMSVNFSINYKWLYTVELTNQMHVSYKVIHKNMYSNLLAAIKNTKEELGSYEDILLYNILVNSSGVKKKGNNTLKNTFLKYAFQNRLRLNFFKLNAQIKRLNLKKALIEIHEKLQSGNILTNPDHEAIASWMRAYVVCYLMGGTIESQKLLEAVNDATCTLDYSQGEELYMFASRLRYRYLLYQKEQDLQEALNIYYDIGNLGGVISTLIIKVIVKCKESGEWLFRQPEWKDIQQLIKLTGNINYKRKCQSFVMVDIVRHLPFFRQLGRKLVCLK